MSKQSILSAAIAGAALVGGLTAANLANAADNPFAAKSLDSGYQQLAAAEGKCGGEKKEAEGKCGEGKEKKKEGKCGEGKCGGAK
jgi:uncharacterized low-complexity protein